MGVTGLWRLVEPAGKPVPVETLENKVLAVDISIWLHQMVKGYQDAKGAPLPNAHLMGLFQRLCKLLYFRIKPVFVFDGGFPALKRETIAKRQDSKAKYNSESERLKRELALLLSKKTAVGSLLGKQISPKKGNITESSNDDIFKLPALPEKEQESESDSEDETSSGSIIDLHSVDIESENFKTMPVKEKYDLLIELRETRKMNSWGKLHELPKKSDNFSNFQMERLLKRRKVQECLEETEKEMGDIGMSLKDLESLLNEEGIDTKIESLPTRRIASDNTTRILMIKNVKDALAVAKQRQEAAEKQIEMVGKEEIMGKKDELQEDLDKAVKLSLECNSDADISAGTSKTDESWMSTMTDSDYSDSEEDDGFEEPDMNCAKAYIMQYCDFTHKAIDNIVAPAMKSKSKPKLKNVDEIIEELNKEKSVIVDNVDLSSSDDDCIQENMPSNETVDKHLSSSDGDCLQENIPTSETFEKQGMVSSSDLETSNVDATQGSIVCIDNPIPDVITLDTSTESAEDSKDVKSELERSDKSDSSDEEFEEVPEDDAHLFKKPVVQITLNMGAAPLEDDIFADVFSNTENESALDKVHNIKDQGTTGKPLSKTTDVKQNHKEKVTKETEIQIIDKNTHSNNKSVDEFLVRPSTSGIKIAKSVTEKIYDTVKPAQEVQIPVEEVMDSDLEKAIQMSLECVGDEEKLALTSESNNKTVELDQENNLPPPKEPITTEQLNTMAEEIQNEEQVLMQEKGRLDRIGRNITEQMTKEAQELLQVFGIPFIVAPMEAEAQCAFLESINLTDGTITDDSDIWLFGGRTVYKNFFNQKKHVMQFQAERIERSFNLTREKLILLALLVGSDYTTGVPGVGPVTALEILASFPFNNKKILTETSKQERYAEIVAGLQEFKKWVRAGKRTDNTSLKKKLKNVALTEEFPSVRVIQAYMEPNIEKSKEKFTWGELDITILRDYAKAKFGWSQNKLDEIIKPVLKRLLDRKNQRSVQDYFKRKIEFQSLEDQMSKRVKAAVQRMGPEGSLQEAETTEEQTKPARKRKINRKKQATEEDTGGPSKPKQQKHILKDPTAAIESEANVLKNHGVTIVSQILDGKPDQNLTIHKTDRFQEIIPQREKGKQSLLQNKMKAIEIFRKTKMDITKKVRKKRVNVPKEKAELSESDSD